MVGGVEVTSWSGPHRDFLALALTAALISERAASSQALFPAEAVSRQVQMQKSGDYG